MKINSIKLAMLFQITSFFIFIFISCSGNKYEDIVLSYEVDPAEYKIEFFWKNDDGEILGTIDNLLKYLDRKKEKAVFITNGGMFHKNFNPVGLFISNNDILVPLDTGSGFGNFYLKPNGVFYITNDNHAFVKTTDDFTYTENIKSATQSGPILVIDGNIHPVFEKDSKHVYIRSGVGILPDGRIIFAMTKFETNLYTFADYFRQLGCKNALYLDGFISRMYNPRKGWQKTDGDFGVMIAVMEK